MSAFAQGYVRLGRLRGVPVFMHWSAPLGALFVSRFRWAPGAWVAFALIVLVHEAGHAVLVQRVGGRALAVEIHGFGGECRWAGEVSPLARATVAWGGVLGQSVVLVLAYVALAVWGPPQDAFVAEMAMAFTTSNMWLMAFNLFPMRPLDGAAAWPIVPMLLARLRTARARRSRARARQLAAREAEALDAQSDAPGRTSADAATDDLFARLDRDGIVGRVPEPHDRDD